MKVQRLGLCDFKRAVGVNDDDFVVVDGVEFARKIAVVLPVKDVPASAKGLGLGIERVCWCH